MGRNTASIPRKNTKVMRNTLYRSLKIEAKYAGKRTVMQQGAKRAASPAMNAAMSDPLISNSIPPPWSLSSQFILVAFVLVYQVLSADLEASLHIGLPLSSLDKANDVVAAVVYRLTKTTHPDYVLRDLVYLNNFHRFRLIG